MLVFCLMVETLLTITVVTGGFLSSYINKMAILFFTMLTRVKLYLLLQFPATTNLFLNFARHIMSLLNFIKVNYIYL